MAKTPNTKSTPCMTLAGLTILLLGYTIRQVQGEDCQALIGLGVLIGCQSSITKEGPQVPPSPDCCRGIQQIGMPCTCKLITKDIEIENIISVDKLVNVAKICGRPLPPGTQCGNYKVPPALI